jgi:hypothetical protein
MDAVKTRAAIIMNERVFIFGTRFADKRLWTCATTKIKLYVHSWFLGISVATKSYILIYSMIKLTKILNIVNKF